MDFRGSLPLWSFMIFLSLSFCLTSSSVHDLLRSKGLPAGLLPREVESYSLSENGLLEVYLQAPCLAKFENRVFFESVVKANLSYGGLIGVEGLSQEELFLWLPVKDIIVDDPSSGIILFDIGVAHKQLSLSLFEDPPSCKPRACPVSEYAVRELSILELPINFKAFRVLGALRSHVRKDKSYEALR